MLLCVCVCVCVCVCEVAQSCPILCNPMDYSLPGSSTHGIFQARVLEWVAIFFSREIFLTQGSNPGLLYCRQMLYRLSHQGIPYATKREVNFHAIQWTILVLNIHYNSSFGFLKDVLESRYMSLKINGMCVLGTDRWSAGKRSLKAWVVPICH